MQHISALTIRIRKYFPLAMLPIVAVCSGPGGTTTEPTPTGGHVVTTVSVDPPTTSIMVGATTTLAATVKDDQGTVMSGQSVSWSTSNTAFAAVSSGGVVSGIAAGTATITATSAGKSGTSVVTVTDLPPPPPPSVASVTVSPTNPSIQIGATVSLTATVKDGQGNVMTGQTVSWSSNSTVVATVNNSGVVTALTAGSATITASAGGKSGTTTVTVTSPPPPAPVVTTVTVSPTSTSVVAGNTVTLTATVKDQQGSVMTGQSIVWSTSNSGAATVSTNGVVTGVAAGTATITATCSGKSGSSTVTVTAPPPPPPPPPPGGGTLLFQENFEDANLASRGWYDNTSAVLSTTEHISGSTASAQYRFPVGATIPTSGNAQRHKFAATSSVYISFYVKYSSNWVGSQQSYHPHEFYFMSNMDGDWDGPAIAYLTLYLEHNYQNGGRPVMMMQDSKSINTTMGALPNNLVGVTENRSTSGCNGLAESNLSIWSCYNAPPWANAKGITGPVTFQPNPGPGYKADWNFVEAYYQLNTVVNGIGQQDGVMQYWFNGQLVIDRHDILYRTGQHPNIQFTQFLIAPYIGDGSPVDQSMFIDNLRVATARIP